VTTDRTHCMPKNNESSAVRTNSLSEIRWPPASSRNVRSGHRISTLFRVRMASQGLTMGVDHCRDGPADFGERIGDSTVRSGRLTADKFQHRRNAQKRSSCGFRSGTYDGWFRSPEMLLGEISQTLETHRRVSREDQRRRKSSPSTRHNIRAVGDVGTV